MLQALTTHPPGGALAATDAARASLTWRGYAVLAALAFALFLPGFFTLSPTDRDESRFAQATKQMVESGDYIDIRFQEQARHKKPVGIYWLQAAAVHASGQGAEAPIWVYRLPSLLGAVGAVLALAWAGAPLVGSAPAFLAAAFLASSLLLGVEARLAKTDAVLLLTVILAQGALARAWTGTVRDQWATPAVFWTAVAAGVLVKGPILLMVTGLTVAALWAVRRRLDWMRALRPGLGALWALLLILPWFIAITAQSRGAFFGESVGQDLLGKVAQGQESHWGPPGTYLLAVWGTFWPWAPLVALAAPWIWRNRRSPSVAFCLAWALPTWIAFELIPTKLPHYVLPVYPALALLAAAAVREGALGLERRSARRTLVLIPALGGAVALASLVLLYVFGGRLDLTASALGLVSLGLLIAGTSLLKRGEDDRALVSVAAGAGALYLCVFGVAVPSMTWVWPSPRLAAAVARNAPCAEPQVATTGYREPSLVFLVGTGTKLTDGAGAAEHLGEPGCRLALVERRREGDFLARLATLGREAVLLERVEGLNLNGGRDLSIGVYRPAGAPQ